MSEHGSRSHYGGKGLHALTLCLHVAVNFTIEGKATMVGKAQHYGGKFLDTMMGKALMSEHYVCTSQ